MDEFVQLLGFFSKASGMEINWEKICAYWFDKYTHKPDWLTGFNWKWADEEDLSKLLGTHFDLNFNVSDVDQFLYSKITRILVYWSTMKLSLTGWALICNHVFISTLWFFTSIWGALIKIYKKIRLSVTTYGLGKNNNLELVLVGGNVTLKRNTEGLD